MTENAKKKNTSRKKLEEDEHVQRMIPDPSQPPPDMVTIVGFLGKSPTPGKWRLYLNAELNEYLELTEDDVLDAQSLKTELNPVGGTMVSVKRTAAVTHARIESRQTQAEFLQGNITSAFLPGANVGSEAGQVAFTPAFGITATVDPITIVSILTTSKTFRCRSTLTFCNQPGCPQL